MVEASCCLPDKGHGARRAARDGPCCATLSTQALATNTATRSAAATRTTVIGLSGGVSHSRSAAVGTPSMTIHTPHRHPRQLARALGKSVVLEYPHAEGVLAVLRAANASGSVLDADRLLGDGEVDEAVPVGGDLLRDRLVVGSVLPRHRRRDRVVRPPCEALQQLVRAISACSAADHVRAFTNRSIVAHLVRRRADGGTDLPGLRRSAAQRIETLAQALLVPPRLHPVMLDLGAELGSTVEATIEPSMRSALRSVGWASTT